MTSIPSISLAALQGKRFLITGASGYLATALVEALRECDCAITRLTRPGRGLPEVSGRGTVRDVAGDIRDPGLWDRLVPDSDVIVHLAAQTSVYVAESDAAADLAVNVLPMVHLLDACRRAGHKPTVLFAGTVTEAGIPETLPVNEQQPDRPITVYDLHKWMAEKYLGLYAECGVVRGTTLRLPNIYGPGPRSGSADRGVLNMMIRKALKGETLTIYGQGRYLRDYLFVEDAVAAFLAAVANADALEGAYYVLGTGHGSTIADAIGEIARRAAQRTGRPVDVTHVPPPPGLHPIETRDFVADPSLFHAATGWTARVSLGDGIERTLRDRCPQT